MSDAWKKLKKFHKAHRPGKKDPFASPWVALPVLALVLVVFVIVFKHYDAEPPIAKKDLPGVALGSGFLLDLLRTALVTAILGVLCVVFIRALFGHWPFEISTSGLKYAPSEVAETHTELKTLVDGVKGLVEGLDERITLVEDELTSRGDGTQGVDTSQIGN